MQNCLKHRESCLKNNHWMRLDIGNFTEGKVIDKGTDQHWILPSCKHKQNADNNSHLQAQYHLIIT
jgi:hypothetical protein